MTNSSISLDTYDTHTDAATLSHAVSSVSQVVTRGYSLAVLVFLLPAAALGFRRPALRPVKDNHTCQCQSSQPASVAMSLSLALDRKTGKSAQRPTSDVSHTQPPDNHVMPHTPVPRWHIHTYTHHHIVLKTHL